MKRPSISLNVKIAWWVRPFGWLCIPFGLLALPYRGACWVVKRYGVKCAPDELGKRRWVERVGGIRPRGT